MRSVGCVACGCSRATAESGRWVHTSTPGSASEPPVSLLFRLFSATGMEPRPGMVCGGCADLVDRIGAAERLLGDLKAEIKDRVRGREDSPVGAEPEPEPGPDPACLDLNLLVTRTTRGHEQLVYQGHTYLRVNAGQQQHSSSSSSSSSVRWKCTQHYAAKSHCRASLKTTLDGLAVLQAESALEHNHPPPDESHLQVILFREQGRRKRPILSS